MASPFKTNSRRNPKLGRQSLKAFLIALILLITMSPGYGGGDSGDDGGGGCGGGDRNAYSDEAYGDYEASYSSGAGFNLSPGGFTDSASGETYIKRLLTGTSNRLDVRLPGYAYFQGIVQAEKHIMVAGQVRIVGGVLGADSGTCSLYSGAMVTTNAHALMGASDSMNGLPDGIRTRIRTWEEIPSQ